MGPEGGHKPRGAAMQFNKTHTHSHTQQAASSLQGGEENRRRGWRGGGTERMLGSVGRALR